MPDSWLQLAVRSAPESLDAIANFLIERGSPGVAIKKHEVRGYFPAPFDVSSVRKEILTFLSAIASDRRRKPRADVSWRIIKDEDWNKRWRKFIKPQKVGKHFWVTPPWIAAPTLRARHVITIEPGMAFGTGSHATTSGCLEFIERVACVFKGNRWTALDVGTGSGILSIALSQLGAATIYAIDNDPVALEVVRDNLQRNNARNNVVLSERPLARMRKTFSVVVANLTAETILELSSALTSRVAASGYLILSGILNAKAERVVTCIQTMGFRLLKRKREQQWTTLLLHRK